MPASQRPMEMEVDEDDAWGAFATGPSAAVISTAFSFSLNTHRLQLPAASGGPFLPGSGCYRDVAASPSSSSFFPRVEQKRAAANAGTSGGTVEERHKKRMIKNRESASQARARKHGRVLQIETEVTELREANEQLRHKYDQLKATVEVSVPVRKTLQRTLSAPF